VVSTQGIGSAQLPVGRALAARERRRKKAPPFAPLVRVIHLTGGAENHFMTIFQGECTHCHKLDVQTGAWSVPSGPEASP